MKKIYLLLFSVITVLTANSQTAELYKDINSLVNMGSISGDPEYTTVGSKVFFVASEPLTGKELYVSDGTPNGTILIDINPGKGSSTPANLIEMNGVLYFTATDGPQSSSGTELWRSDGTPTGTMMVKDIYESSGIGSNPAQLTNVNGILYFAATSAGVGKELWKSDGTEDGTKLVKDIRDGTPGSNPYNLLPIGDILYFVANDGINGYELWRTSVTDNKTEMVKDIKSNGDSNPNYLTNLNGVLFFSADDGISGNELWKSDGTEGGTMIVKDASPGTASPTSIYAFGNNVYYAAYDGDRTLGMELWKSDGSPGGTKMVKDINPGGASSSPGNFMAIGSTLYFAATTNDNGRELWKTDGESETVQVKDLNPGTNGSSPSDMTVLNGKLYFRTPVPSALWVSNGTEAGTIKINDAVIGGGSITNTHAGPHKIYFTYNGYKEGIPSTATGAEPWVSDGTDGGTDLLKDINMRNGPSNPFNFCKIGNTIYFTANDGIVGNELWKTDGTESGTMLVKDIRTGPTNSDPAFLTNVNGTLFFTAYTNDAGWELWKSNGTEDGTVMIKDINPGTNGSNPYSFASINGLLYFTASHPDSGFEIWRSDGTPGGTKLVKDINSGTTGSNPANYTEVNGTIFFTASNGGTGTNNDEELWKTDGTADNTVRVKDIRSGDAASNPRGLTSFKNKLFFTATDDTNGNEMWVSDGTTDGTILFKDFIPGSGHGFPKNYTVIRDTMYFAARGTTGAGALWKSDGTVDGTVKIKQTSSASVSGSEPNEFTLSKGSIFFTAYADGAEKELWKTDGYEASTLVVKDILPGGLSSNIEMLTDFKGTLYFKARGELNNVELWKSDGTEEGTLSMNLNPYESSNPFELTVLNDYLIFTANDFYKGFEMWRIENFALPLSLLDFTAQKNGNKVLLKWQTTNEVNTSVFEIERTGTSGFVKIGEVSAINRTGDHRYSSYDEQPLKGTNLYRLKMIDIDGSFTYSNIQRVDFNSVAQIRISPNPASNELKISDVKGYEILQVMDASGRVVHQQKISGDQEIVNIQKLLPGNYVVRLTGKGIQKSLQFVKK